MPGSLLLTLKCWKFYWMVFWAHTVCSCRFWEAFTFSLLIFFEVLAAAVIVVCAVFPAEEEYHQTQTFHQ